MMSVEKPLFSPAIDVAQRLAERTSFVQTQVIEAAWQFLDPAIGDRWSLVAVGGFGRGDLCPYSDVDLLLVVDRQETALQSKDAISFFLRALWDAGLSPSHSVHTVDECCQLDSTNVELTISLLTQRYLAGGQALHSQLAEKLPTFVRTQRRSVTEKLLRLAAERWTKFQDTIYHLEPDVKEAPGGVRDLHLIEWLGLLRGAPYQEALDALRPARDFLSAVRICLHDRAKRNDNRLLFDAQDDLFENPAESMREYYRHAREVNRETQFVVSGAEPDSGMLRSFLDWRSRLSNAEFTVSREQILLRTPQMLSADPNLPLRLMQFVARHGFALARDTERRLTDLVRSPSFEVPNFGLWREMRDLLSLPHAAKAVRIMHETGLLKKVLPEWTRIECLVTRDFYHRYTVDEHTLVTLENLEYLAASKDDARRPFRDLLSETADVYLLRFALLMHDIGKGGGTGEHSEESMRIASDVLDRLIAEPAERETILYLIEHHLDLSSLMTSRDLHDSAVAESAAQQIGTIERLQLLTLLTFADISAVNPTALSPWRMAQLWSAYRSLHHEFTRELDTQRIGSSPALAADRASFLDGFPTRYLRVHTPAEIDEHFAMSQKAGNNGVAVVLTNQRDSWILTVVTRDRAGLFADLAGTLASFGMNILRAEAFGNSSGVVLDILRFSDPVRRLELNPDEVNDLISLVERVVLGKENVKKRLAARPKSSPPSKRSRIEPIIGFDGQASEKATLLEVVAEDRPGLLYDLAKAISDLGCSIEVVLVNTEAHKALDVFYLTSSDDKLSPSLQESLGESLRRILAA